MLLVATGLASVSFFSASGEDCRFAPSNGGLKLLLGETCPEITFCAGDDGILIPRCQGENMVITKVDPNDWVIAKYRQRSDICTQLLARGLVLSKGNLLSVLKSMPTVCGLPECVLYIITIPKESCLKVSPRPTLNIIHPEMGVNKFSIKGASVKEASIKEARIKEAGTTVKPPVANIPSPVSNPNRTGQGRKISKPPYVQDKKPIEDIIFNLHDHPAPPVRLRPHKIQKLEEPGSSWGTSKDYEGWFPLAALKHSYLIFRQPNNTPVRLNLSLPAPLIKRHTYSLDLDLGGPVDANVRIKIQGKHGNLVMSKSKCLAVIFNDGTFGYWKADDPQKIYNYMYAVGIFFANNPTVNSYHYAEMVSSFSAASTVLQIKSIRVVYDFLKYCELDMTPDIGYVIIDRGEYDDTLPVWSSDLCTEFKEKLPRYREITISDNFPRFYAPHIDLFGDLLFAKRYLPAYHPSEEPITAQKEYSNLRDSSITTFSNQFHTIILDKTLLEQRILISLKLTNRPSFQEVEISGFPGSQATMVRMTASSSVSCLTPSQVRFFHLSRTKWGVFEGFFSELKFDWGLFFYSSLETPLSLGVAKDFVRYIMAIHTFAPSAGIKFVDQVLTTCQSGLQSIRYMLVESAYKTVKSTEWNVRDCVAIDRIYRQFKAKLRFRSNIYCDFSSVPSLSST